MTPEEKAEKWGIDKVDLIQGLVHIPPITDLLKQAYLAGYAEAERERTNLRSILNDLDELRGGIQHEPRTRKSI